MWHTGRIWAEVLLDFYWFFTGEKQTEKISIEPVFFPDVNHIVNRHQ